MAISISYPIGSRNGGDVKNNLKIFLRVVTLAALCACGRSEDEGGYDSREIKFPNIGNNGIFDPSITQDGTGKLWMSYSEVNFQPGTTAFWSVRTRIASSNDAGASWVDAGLITDTLPAVVTLPYEGWWQQEMSRIAYDADDSDTTRRWKMLWHRYIYVHNTDTGAHGPTHENGWISLKVAGSSDGLASAVERKLFTGYAYNTANDTTIGPPEFPLASQYPGLADCAVFAEPGMLAVANGVNVVLRCAPAPLSSDIGKIVLLTCTHTPAKAFASCSYQGNFLTDTEASDHGAYDGFSAPDLVNAGAKNYLIVTPTNSDGYRGCLVFEVADLATATLVRDGSDKAVVVKSINTASSADHFGACGYHAGATGSGVIHGEYRASSVPNFRLFRSGSNL